MTLHEAAVTAIEQCLRLDQTEACVVITDDERIAIGEALYSVATEITDDTVILRYPGGTQHGEEPPGPIAAAMREADVFIAPTTKSLSHTRARSRACDAGARGATMPGITETIMTMGLDADYTAIAAACDTVLEQVRGAAAIRVTTPAGTDITFEIGTRDWRTDTGIIHEPGDFSNLPAGEVFVSPESATGTFVVDGTMNPYGLLDGRTLEFDVEDGYVTQIGDDQIRAEIETAAETVGQAAYNLAELGIGTNMAVRSLIGSVLLDEKAAGTVHIAIGDDAGIGGEVEAPIHTDGILTEPTVTADGTPVELPRPT